MPTVDDVRALARSSRLLWRDVRFTWSVDGGEPRRGWVRRPGAYRVETLDGAVIQAEGRPPRATTVGEWVVVEDADGRRAVFAESYTDPVPSAVLLISDDDTQTPDITAAEAIGAVTGMSGTEPVLRPDGLASILRVPFGDDTVPMFENYQWVAMLDPIELADGMDDSCDADDVVQAPPPATYGELREVDHHGRPALEVVMTPTLRHYSPRCGCCPLLDGAVALQIEEEGFGAPLPGYVDDPEARPDATRFRVRVDRATGICVLVEALDGSHPERHRLDVRIEAVDADPADELFVSTHGV